MTYHFFQRGKHKMIQKGPIAPKDPKNQRKGFYILLDTIIEASERREGRPTQEIYLDNGRLIHDAKIVGGITDEKILSLLETCEGFKKLVKQVGVSVTSKDAERVNFIFQNYGKEDRYGGGTLIQMECPCDGAEYILDFAHYKWSNQDNVVGKMAFEFNQSGMTAKVSVKLYVDEMYDIPEVKVDLPVDFKSKDYEEMIKRSLMSLGNNARLKKVIEKAKRGEEVTIAYIGGSITQGAGAKPIHTECYAAKSFQQFKESFTIGNGNNLHFIKAGVGGTSSELGMIRYEKDVLRDGKVYPDLVVIEFAVNDEGDETKGICYESLVLKCLKAENRPAVILLFSVFANDWNLQDRLAPIGKYYDLPMVSVLEAVVPQFTLERGKGGVITKRQYFYDLYHPTNDGHQIMADCLTYLFKKANEAKWDEEIEVCQKPYKGDSFIDVQRLDRKYKANGIVIEEGSFSEIDNELQCVEMDDSPYGTPQFPYNWKHAASSGSESFKMSIESKNLVLVFKDSGNVDVGKALIYVDGILVKEAEPYLNGWTHCNPVILYSEKEVKHHEVEIKMAEGDENKCFTILGFGYTAR